MIKGAREETFEEADYHSASDLLEIVPELERRFREGPRPPQT